MIRGARKKVFVAMSGGVDSSVATLLLKKQGCDVVGVFMRCFNVDGCAERDAEDARRVAEKLEIPFYVFDFEEEYKRRVVDYMISGYRAGITPNPDVMCNKEIKFGLFLEKALELGADFIATGHYVKLATSDKRQEARNGNASSRVAGRLSLYSARDSAKDQSYFLWALTQEQLRHCLFPIGDYLKSEVREIARKAGLPTAEKKDSQGICFLGKITLDEFLKQYIPEKPGAALSISGQRLGEHQGAHFYTIGQRHIGRKYQVASSKGKHETLPLYVADKDTEANTITLAEGDTNPALYKKEIELTDVNFINQQPITDNEQQVYARVRYRQPLAEAKLITSKLGSYELIFEQPQKFVAPGQSAVFYNKDDEIFGGGIIA